LKDFLFRHFWLWLAIVAGIVLFGVLLTRVWALAHYSWFVAHYPFQIDYDEGVNLHAAWLLSQGQSIYIPLDPNRFVSAPYTPLYYLLVALPLRWTGPALEWGRLLSLLATLGTAALLGGMAARATRRWPIGLLCALFYLALSPVQFWACLYKQDMLAILFTVAGLYVVQRWTDHRAVYWAVPLFALAFFTKQTALIGPAVGSLYLLVHGLFVTTGRQRGWAAWRRAGLFALVSAAAIALPFLLLDLLLQHNLYLHAFTYQRLPWVLERLLKNLNKLVSLYPYLIGLDLVAAAYLVYRRKALLYPLYLVVTTGAILVANGIEGANYNLLLDIFSPLCLLFGALLGELWDMRQHGAARVVLLLTTLTLLWQGLHLSPLESWYNPLPTPERGARMEIIRNLLANSPGPMLSEDVGLLLLAGHAVEYDDPSTFSPLARANVWDDRVLAEKISARYYTLIILYYDITDLTGAIRWSPRVFQALKESYQVQYRDVLFIYRPNP